MAERPRQERFHPAIVTAGERPRAIEPAEIPGNPLAGLGAEARRALPNLICIGAAKCGTSALHEYLAAHPQIGMSAQKELKLFGARTWHQRLGWYAGCFDAALPVRGESSPSYAMDPVVPLVPEQMAAVLPEPRFVYLVGDPVRRAVAHWREHAALAFERRTLKEALADAEDPRNPYVAASRYGHQLERFTAVFGAGRVLVVDQEDLRARRRETLREVFAFAGVDPEFWSPAFEREANAAADKLQPNRLGRWVLDRTGASARGKRLATVRGLTAQPIPEAVLDDATRARLQAALRPDAARFRELTGRAFAHWLV